MHISQTKTILWNRFSIGDRFFLVSWWKNGPNLLLWWFRSGGVSGWTDVLVIYAKPGPDNYHLWGVVSWWSAGKYRTHVYGFLSNLMMIIKLNQAIPELQIACVQVSIKFNDNNEIKSGRTRVTDRMCTPGFLLI